LQRIRLIFEQIDEAKRLLQTDTVLNLRLAMILLDNAGELIMSRVLREEFGWHDALRLASTELKYTKKDRANAERFFEGKSALLVKLAKITADQGKILVACHQFRGEMYHAEQIRFGILRSATAVLFHTIIDLAEKLPPSAYFIPHANDKDHNVFLSRFGIAGSAESHGSDLIKRVSEAIRSGIELGPERLPHSLSRDLVERIDETIGCLFTMHEGKTEREIDLHIRHVQFWRAAGARLMEEGVREPELTLRFEAWNAAGAAKFTIPRLKRWKRTAEQLAASEIPTALSAYCTIDDQFRPFEREIHRAIVAFDDEINMQIHDRRFH
jgi:hypothetical protein